MDPDGDAASRLAVDMNIAAAMRDYSPRVLGSGTFADLSGSKVVVITDAGGSVDTVAAEARDRAPDATILVVADPVEPTCHAAYETTVFARERVVGVAVSVHSAAFRVALARELATAVRDVSAVVLGGHGNLVPILSCATVSGMPVRRRVAAERLEEIAQGVKDAAAPLVDAPVPAGAVSAAVLEFVDGIIRDGRRVLPCAALCKGEYGFEEVFVGLPARIGAGGIDEIVEMDLDDDERAGLEESARAVEATMAELRGG